MEPYEIIAAPFSIYMAPVGEAFPAVDAAPAGNWTLIGTSGDLNYSDEGVTVAHAQTIEKARPLGSTGPRKAFRTEEDMMIRFTLWDMSLEQYRRAINDNAVATTAAGSGTAGFKALKLYRGVNVAALALLARANVSAYGDGWKSQYEVPVCYQSGSPEPEQRTCLPAGPAPG